MRLRDIIRQAGQSLFRHKGRTLLTVLGVVVGCCSVVIMVSIGIGMQISTAATLAQMGDLTMITVEASGNNKELKLDEQSVAMMEAIDNVEAIIPKLTVDKSCTLKVDKKDRYEADYVQILGIDLDKAKFVGYELTDGEWESLKNGNALAGEYLPYSFVDTKRPEGNNRINYWENYDYETDTFVDVPDPYVNILKDKLVLEMGEQNDSSSEKTASAEITVAGVIKADSSRGYETYEGLIVDMDTLINLTKAYNKANGVKSSNGVEFTSVMVKVNDISKVKDVEKEIKRMGFSTYSMESVREPIEKEMKQKQMLLGCVGGVSFFVAALGIANTMIMAITERTKEIGVMKSLGCSLRDIRRMFLLEAGIIGMLGGIIGLGLSILVSMIMNGAGGSTLFGNGYEYLIEGEAMKMSVITWQLALEAIAFSVFVGVISGLYPAGKAVRISALEAIRRE